MMLVVIVVQDSVISEDGPLNVAARLGFGSLLVDIQVDTWAATYPVGSSLAKG